MKPFRADPIVKKETTALGKFMLQSISECPLHHTEGVNIFTMDGGFSHLEDYVPKQILEDSEYLDQFSKKK